MEEFMKKLSTKVIAVFLCCIMVFSAFATTSFAANASDQSVDDKALSDDTPYTNELDCPEEEIFPTDHTHLSSESNNGICDSTIDPLSIPSGALITVSDSKESILSSITSTNPFEIEGTISDNEIQYDLNDFYDFSSTSQYHIVDWAYRAGLITEAEKIEAFCELITNRNFENIECLEGVIDTIQCYQNSVLLSDELENKINIVLSKPTYISDANSGKTRAIDKEATYNSSNFTIHYDTDSTNSSTAQTVATYFEQVRSEYISLGFRTPILESGQSRYHVYLDPESKPGSTTPASCFKVNSLNSTTCPSYIVLYSFTGLNNRVRERIAHEYFHAIQNAYNHDSSWFKEACANWGKINVAGSSLTCDDKINSFIESTLAMNDETTQYGAVVYPLTVQRRYGIEGILSIYDKYSEQSSTSLTEAQLSDVITKGIQATGTTEGFGLVYRAMSSYIYDTSVWYTSVYSGASSWVDAPTTTRSISLPSSTSVTNSSSTISGTLNELRTIRYELTLPTGFKGAIKFEMSYSDIKGKTQIYTIEDTGVPHINYVKTSTDDNTAEYLQADVGNGVNTVVLIVSNTAIDYAVNYTAKITLLPLESNISCSSSFRYVERSRYLGAGEYAEFQVTFNTSGSKLMQTFGNKDVEMELYSSSGTLLASDDDDGYFLNSLIRYYVTAGNTYKIRVYFYSSTNSGFTKLSITPAFGALADNVETLETYENIYSITDNTSYSWNTFAQQNYSRVITFKPPTNGKYLFETESDFDTYIYVIDPRSTELLAVNVDYNDDGGDELNASLTIELSQNIPYLVIYSAYNPNSLTEQKDLTLKIRKKLF